MSTFKFNFSRNDEDEVIDVNKSTENEIQWLEAEEVSPDDQLKNFEDYVDHAKMFMCGDLEIGHVVPNEVIEKLGTNFMDSVVLAEKENSDLVSGKYEGGLKIWECTVDLIEHLLSNEDKDLLKEKNILDLGCGAGLLGIYTFINGASVTFQDYNKEILQHVTIPNILLNIEEDVHKTEVLRCKFYSGDWASFNNKISDLQKFDMILSSETIYNPCNYQKILDLITKRLKNNGVAYIAAKTHYFGVGGGTRIFESALQKHGFLKSEVCWKSSGGIQREILKITHQ